MVERQVVAEQDEAVRLDPQLIQQPGQGRDILAMDFDQLQLARRVGRHFGQHGGVDRLHQRAFAHAARAPQQRVVGGKSQRELLGIVQQDVAHMLDAAQQIEIDPADRGDRHQAVALGMPGKGVGQRQVDRRRRRRRQTVERVGDAAQEEIAIGREGHRAHETAGKGGREGTLA